MLKAIQAQESREAALDKAAMVTGKARVDEAVESGRRGS